MVMIFSGKIADINSEKMQHDMDDLTGAIKIKLDTAKAVHDGYEESFYLPEKIMSHDYLITIDGEFLTLTIPAKPNRESVVIIPEINGNFQTGLNKIVKNGEIYINWKTKNYLRKLQEKKKYSIGI